MKAEFQLREGAVIPVTDGRGTIIVYSAPTAAEKQEVIDDLGLDPCDIESALDPDEMSRVEFTPDRIAVIWKRPTSVSFTQRQLRFDVLSVGLFLHRNRLIIVAGEEGVSFSAKEFQGAVSPVDALLRFLLHTVHHYLGHLKVIKQITVDLGSQISASMENPYLLQMYFIRESLIYYQNAIEANAAVLTKLEANAERCSMPQKEIEFLHDVMLDNQQCARQAKIYSSVLSGLMDARSATLNNNVNMLLKNLTLINIIFLPLTLIASIGGMSEFSMMTQDIDWRVSYLLLVLGMVALGFATWAVLVRTLNAKNLTMRQRFRHLWLRTLVSWRAKNNIANDTCR